MVILKNKLMMVGEMEEKFKEFIREQELKMSSRATAHIPEDVIETKGINPDNTYISTIELELFFEEIGKTYFDAQTDAIGVLAEEGFVYRHGGFMKPPQYTFCHYGILTDLVGSEDELGGPFKIMYHGIEENCPVLSFWTPFNENGNCEESTALERQCVINRNDEISRYGHEEGTFRLKVAKETPHQIILEYLGHVPAQ